jgi:hypothetical protein
VQKDRQIWHTFDTCQECLIAQTLRLWLFGMTSYILIDRYHHFRGTCCLSPKAVEYKMLVVLWQTTWCHTSEEGSFNIRHHNWLKSEPEL